MLSWSDSFLRIVTMSSCLTCTFLSSAYYKNAWSVKGFKPLLPTRFLLFMVAKAKSVLSPFSKSRSKKRDSMAQYLSISSFKENEPFQQFNLKLALCSALSLLRVEDFKAVGETACEWNLGFGLKASSVKPSLDRSEFYWLGISDNWIPLSWRLTVSCDGVVCMVSIGVVN